MPLLRHPTSRMWVALAGAALSGIAGGATQPWSPLPGLATPSASAARDPEGPAAIVPMGRALKLTTANGRIVSVAVLGVRLRPGHKRLIDVHLRYTLRRGSRYRMDPAREAQIVDGSDQLLAPAAANWRKPSLRPGLLRQGHPQDGWVTFRLSTAARVVRVQVTLDTSPRTGQWRVTPRR
jgi:hypothetical protein